MSIKSWFEKSPIQTVQLSWRRIWVVVIAVVVIVGMFFSAGVIYANSYKYKVLPGVYLGDLHIGGMDDVSLKSYLQTMNTKLSDHGIDFAFEIDGNKQNFNIATTSVGEDDVRDLVYFDVDKEVDYLIHYRKSGGIISDFFSALAVRVQKPQVSLSDIYIDKDYLEKEIDTHLVDYVSDPIDASIDITNLDPLDYKVTSSSVGVVFDYQNVVSTLFHDWSNLKSPKIFINVYEKEADVKEQDVMSILDRLPHVFDAGNLTISYTDSYTGRDYNWYIDDKDIASWIQVSHFMSGKNGEESSLVFSLDTSSTQAFFEEYILPTVDVEPKDAKFSINDYGRVTEFIGSHPGITVDMDKTLADLEKAFASRTLHDEGIITNVTLTTQQVEPTIKTGEVNDLGISEILGYGHSNFSGSPSNRIQNIRNAAFNKLDGLLIKPGEEFSLVTALKPFTIEGGYLPELVIKGDRIKPEIGGGLCQIGTTMFRAAMNSGMPITERRNHSLVVSYYNDLSNGNPGTDATIYDAHPDFRFLNDTGNYILVTSEMNVNTGDLYFYFWGTNDGREGYYSAPVVTKWIPAGADKTIETTELAPGEVECQIRHTGAEANFTYTRVLPSGEKVDRVFESYYRPLPKICLVGVEEGATSGQNVEDDTSDSPTSEEVVCKQGEYCPLWDSGEVAS